MRSWVKTLSIIMCCLGFSNKAYSYFEISANGSYYKYSNGLTRGEQNNTIVQRYGGGIAYKFFGNTSLEFKYTSSKNLDKYTQETLDSIYRIQRTTEFKNYGLNLVIEFADRRAPFRPFITGGLGYMIRNSSLKGTIEDIALLNGQQELSFHKEPTTKSLSADGGIGFKLFVADRIAIEGSFNVFATDLDQPEIFLHYSAAGGLRYVF